jgi:nucleotide-binding universal stress UspA family protein
LFERILFAIDEIGANQDFVSAVAAIAKAFSSEVTVYHIRERTVTSVATLEHESIPQSFQLGESAAARLQELGVSALAVVDSAEPGQVAGRILEKSRELSAELIVVGGHRDRTMRERIFGDVAETLLHGADAALLVIPTG